MFEISCSDIYQRVREKKESYQRYSFERLQEEAFATFFDLAQEYTHLDNLYQIAVSVPKVFFDLESRLHVICSKSGQLELVSSSEKGLVPAEKRTASNLDLAELPFETEESWVFPIRGNETLTRWIPFHSQSKILGLFEIYPKEKMDPQSHFFFEKFTNRIGYNLHQKLLIQQNIEHIKFINQLVSDIEHNVISPNLYYKLFLIRLNKQIKNYVEIQKRLHDLTLFLEQDHPMLKELCRIYRDLLENNEKLAEESEALAKHYEHTSLFLETLLRRDHFEKGTYVLKKQACNFRTEIIEPLLERYLPMLKQREIAIDDRFESVPDEEMILFVDKGLISQVFDNFFSNALKYTEEVEDQLGRKIKRLSYYRQIVKNAFGEGTLGAKFNFFSTGTPLSQEEAAHVFDEGFRASNSKAKRGEGHGLHFVRNVVEIHGGIVGVEPQRYGNIFYFILPLKDKTPEHEEM